MRFMGAQHSVQKNENHTFALDMETAGIVVRGAWVC